MNEIMVPVKKDVDGWTLVHPCPGCGKHHSMPDLVIFKCPRRSNMKLSPKVQQELF